MRKAPIAIVVLVLALLGGPAASAQGGDGARAQTGLPNALGGAVLGAQVEAQTVSGLCAAGQPQSDAVQTTVLAYNRPRLENDAGQPDFGSVNRDIDRELACGLQPMLRLGVAAADDPGVFPSDPDAYAGLLTALAAAEKGRVQRYAIENEVSAPGHWADSVDSYFRLVRLARDAIHAGDPSATVLDSTFASGALSTVRAHEIFDAGDGPGALALLREIFYNELGSGPTPPATVEDARAYLSSARAKRFYSFFDGMLANQDLFDAFQLHYYGPSQSLPEIVEMLRRRGLRAPIETWELNHRYLDGRPFVEADFADEVSRLFATAIGEGSGTTVLSRYTDYAPNGAQGLTAVGGGSHASRFSFRTLLRLLSGATASGPLDLPLSVTAYAYVRPAGRVVAFWALGGSGRVGSRLGFEATSAAVSGDQSVRPRHLRLSTLRATPGPQFAEADLATLRRLGSPGGRRMRIEVTCPPASPFARCAGELRVNGKAKGRSRELGARAYALARGRSHIYSVALRGEGRPSIVIAAASRCPGGVKPCRSWLRLR